VVDSILNMLCTALVEGGTREVMEAWLKKLENFLCYIMLLSETQANQGDSVLFQKVQAKFAEVLTFGLSFLFH